MSQIVGGLAKKLIRYKICKKFSTQSHPNPSFTHFDGP